MGTFQGAGVAPEHGCKLAIIAIVCLTRDLWTCVVVGLRRLAAAQSVKPAIADTRVTLCCSAFGTTFVEPGRCTEWEGYLVEPFSKQPTRAYT